LHFQKLIPFVSNGLVNAASQLLQSFSIVLVSLIVVPTQGIEFWGKFIGSILLPGLLIQLVSGGNTSYLLRKFSFYPQHIKQEWQENYTTRSVVYAVLAFGLLVSIPLESPIKFSIFFWATGNFLYQPFLVLILFNRKFIFSLSLEIGTLVPTLTYIYFNTLSVNELLIIIGISFYIKIIFACFLFREIVFNKIKAPWKPSIFVEVLPFFALSLIGILASRVGLYIAVFLLPDRELGIYQLINSFFSNVQVMAFFFIQPAMKNIYRMTARKIKIMASKMLLFGSIFLVAGTAVIWCVLELYFDLNISPAFLIAGYLMALPYYYYAIYMNKITEEGQGLIIKISLISIAANFILSFVFISTLEVLGPLMANAITQWGLLAFHFFYNENKKAT
jgi:hypothetical protein